MPRVARVVFPGVPHHVTQRGNRREDVFFEEEDRVVYLAWLREYTKKHKVEVVAYCLMTSHVHLIMIPKTEDALHGVLKPLHMRYAQRINRIHGWNGHVWQGRYFSAPLDEAYTWAAIRYAERNSVRAQMVDTMLAEEGEWSRNIAGVQDWSNWLAEADEPEKLEILRRNVDKGLPCGSEEFIERLSTDLSVFP